MIGERERRDVTRRRLLRGTAAAGALLSGASLPAAAESGDADRPVVAPATPTVAATDRLADRRYVATGTRAYVVGTEAGRFPAMGWHINGEMGGVWSPPLKLLDGIWFGVDGEWFGEATRFESRHGHVSMDLPGREGLSVRRVDFVPDGRRAALFGLRFAAGDAERSFTLAVEARSELMSAYPWGTTTPSQEAFNLADDAAFEEGRLRFRETGTPPVEHADHHDWAATVGATLDPVDGATGEGFWGPQAPVDVCPPDESDEQKPARCDDSAFGEGRGGRLVYEVTVPAGETRTVWVGVAGSESGPDAAREELDAALSDPETALARKVERRGELADNTTVDLPGNRLLERSVEWSKQNLADSVQVATDLNVRYTNEGEEFPPPTGSIDRVRFLGAGFPDYPWLFGTDGEYATFAAVAAGQFGPVKDHLRALKEASEIVNEGSGKLVHEVITTGAVYYGAESDPGNTDETAKFPTAVATIWRWTGDDAFRDELYAFARKGMRYVTEELDTDGDCWPEGQGNVERPGMGEEKLDVAVYTIRGLFDLADMARSKGDAETAEWATDRARRLLGRFVETWWIPEIPQHAGSIDAPENGTNDNERIYQRHWIGATPMSAEYVTEDGIVPGIAESAHGDDALDLRETDCYSGVGDDRDADQRRNEGLYHTGAPGCDEGSFEGTKDSAERSIFTLNSAIMAVAEGNYGRLGPNQQRRYADANAKLQLPNPDEQPGAMPEIAPSPNYGRSIDKPFTERAMVLQAWGTYGTLWPVVRQQLGVRPDAGRDRLTVVPQVPEGERRVSGENVRVGDGSVAVAAGSVGNAFLTRVDADADLDSLAVGHVLPDDADVAVAFLDGERVDPTVRETNRGREAVVETAGAGARTFLVIAR